MIVLYSPALTRMDRTAARCFDCAMMMAVAAVVAAIICLCDYAGDGVASLENRTWFSAMLAGAVVFSLLAWALTFVAGWLVKTDEELDPASRFAVGDFEGDLE